MSSFRQKIGHSTWTGICSVVFVSRHGWQMNHSLHARQNAICRQNDFGSICRPRVKVSTTMVFGVLSLNLCMFSSQSAHLTANQFNWLGTIFYLSYLVFEYPQNLALQHFPVGKWMR